MTTFFFCTSIPHYARAGGRACVCILPVCRCRCCCNAFENKRLCICILLYGFTKQTPLVGHMAVSKSSLRPSFPQSSMGSESNLLDFEAHRLTSAGEGRKERSATGHRPRWRCERRRALHGQRRRGRPSRRHLPTLTAPADTTRSALVRPIRFQPGRSRALGG